MNLGLVGYYISLICFYFLPLLKITNDLKVVATTKEQQQKIRAHELIERREQLLQVQHDIALHLMVNITKLFSCFIF